jgi:thiamine kinase
MHSREVQRAAQALVPGSGAVELKSLVNGIANRSYLVLRAGASYVLRFAEVADDAFVVDRDWECKVLRAASSCGLAPPLFHCDPQSGVTVTGWVAGESWSRGAAQRPDNLLRLAAALRQLHALAVPEPPRCMSPADWCVHYQRILQRRAGTDARFEVDSDLDTQLSRYAAMDKTQALCHSDLHRHNLLDAGSRLVFVDWEYAHVGDPLWDLAGWITNHELDDFAQQALLAAYFERLPTVAEIERLESLRWLYRYVCALWKRCWI